MFISRISSPFICLIFATLRYALLTYESGAFQDGEFFNYTNSSLGGSPDNTGEKSVEDNSVRDSWALSAKELAEDLKKAEQTHLIPCGYFKEGSPMLPDIVSEENNVPIMYAENDELEYSCSPANDRYNGSTEEVEDAQSTSGDSEDASSEPSEDGDKEAEDECEDSEDNNKSDADL
ncbi:hypothetical protein BGX38DRAFT_1264900 [Terfezia claveryi]|nr:hypothetical protein BGX38DRAFT_1264900 [Terfezia claveryi]